MSHGVSFTATTRQMATTYLLVSYVESASSSRAKSSGSYRSPSTLLDHLPSYAQHALAHASSTRDVQRRRNEQVSGTRTNNGHALAQQPSGEGRASGAGTDSARASDAKGGGKLTASIGAGTLVSGEAMARVCLASPLRLMQRRAVGLWCAKKDKPGLFSADFADAVGG